MNAEGSELTVRDISRNVISNGAVKAIVGNLSYTFKRRGLYTIIGPSGAGKSSFLRLLNRLDEISEGEILLDNIDIREKNPCLLRQEIAYLHQTPYLFPKTVKDNFSYVAPDVSDDSIVELLSRVDMGEGFLNENVQSLSVGERQRVSIARLMLLNPSVLLLDEPTSALDAGNTSRIEKLVKDFSASGGRTIIMATHKIEQALRFQGEGLLLVRGKLVESGPIRSLVENPETPEGKEYICNDGNRT